jgi:sugar phosphate isomerase/epimerase
VTTPQEPTRTRIVPFRSRRSRRTAQQAPTPPGDDASGDRLLGVSPVDDPLPGEGDGVHHLRAVGLGASSGAFYPHTPTELTPIAAARLGITAMEIMLQTAGEYDPAFIAGVSRNANASGVTIGSVHLMSRLHPFLDAYPRRVDEAHAMFRRGVEAAVALGARVLVWHGPNAREVATVDGWERFIALTQQLAETCGAAGITLGIENVSYGALAQVRNVVSFATRLEEIGPRHVGFVFDPFQAAEAGANPFMLLAAMGNRVVNVHISDLREHDPGARHLLPGDGDLPWSALIRAIAGSGYRGPMMIEGPLGQGTDGMTRVRQVLEPLIRTVFPFNPDARRDEDATTLVAPPVGVLRGIALFNQRAFYEQHEEIEAEWHAERGPIRRLYQGLLQIGVGFHHALNGNYKGAVALLGEGIAKTSEFVPQALGIETGRLVAESRACLDRIVALGPEGIGGFDDATIPTIRFALS